MKDKEMVVRALKLTPRESQFFLSARSALALIADGAVPSELAPISRSGQSIAELYDRRSRSLRKRQASLIKGIKNTTKALHGFRGEILMCYIKSQDLLVDVFLSAADGQLIACQEYPTLLDG